MTRQLVLKEKRLCFIDQCKGIGIILMVYGHCCTTEFLNINFLGKGISVWLCSFHMPLFFIVGGCLIAYKRESFYFQKL